MIRHTTTIRVWYCDTDQMGIVHHSNYIRYYEAARSDFMRSLGLSYGDVEQRGIMMPILEVQSKYRKPALYDEELTITTLLDELPTARINFRYEIRNAKGDLLNTGTTQLGFRSAETRRPCRCPEWFMELLKTKWQE
ncbi:MAG: acyl-CoA thioesterase [Alistipes sp.]|nr:acyl-CoA thioesterase [Alistipes sp.]